MDFNKIYGKFSGMLDGLGVIALNPDPLEKAARAGHKVTDLVGSFVTLNNSFQLVGVHLKRGCPLLETVQFAGKIREIACSAEGQPSFFAINSWRKSVDKVSMAAHCCMKSVRTLAVQEILTLGKFATKVSGGLTVFSLITDAFLINSCIFTIWESSIDNKKALEVITLADRKITKWEGRKAHLRQENLSEEKVISYKLNKWSVLKSNASLTQKAALIAGVHSVGLICLVSTAMAFSAANLASVAAVRLLLTIGIVTDVIGVTRFMYNHYNKSLPVPKSAHLGLINAA